METKQQKTKKTAPTASGSQYKVSGQTAAFIGCIEDINRLVDKVADTALLLYDNSEIDEAMQPVNDAAIQMQEAILNLTKDSIRDSIIYGGKHLTEI